MAETRRGSADEGARAPTPGGSPRAGGRRGALRAFARDSCGGTAIEYAMIGGLIFAVAASGIRLFGTRSSAIYDRIGTTISQVD